MSKNRKRAKKSKDNVPAASAQQCSETVNDSICSEPVHSSTSSEPVNDSMSNEQSEIFSEKASGVNKIEEHSTTSSKTTHTITDEHSVKHEPPESNQEANSHLKNTCHALKSSLNTITKKYEEEKQLKESSLEELSNEKNKSRALKSNLNAMKKKYEEEKHEKEKLYGENQDLKYKLLTTEKELQAAKMEIEKLKKESAQRQYEEMEDQTIKENVCQQQEQEASVDSTREKKEDNLVQYNAKGNGEELSSIVEQDIHMAESFNREESGVAKGNEHDWNDTDDKQCRQKPSAWDTDTEAESSSQPSNNSSVLAASGSDTRWQEGRETGQKHNEWPQRKQFYKNEEQHHGSRHFSNSGKGRGLDNRGDRDQNYRREMDDRRGMGNRRRMDERVDHGQNQNHNLGRGRGFDYRGDHDQNYRRGIEDRRGLVDRVDHGQNQNHNWGRDRRADNRGDHDQNYGRGLDDRGNRGQNYNNWGRERGYNNRGGHDQNYQRGMNDRGALGQNYNQIENDCNRCDNRMQTAEELPVVTEVFGDLFTAPSDCSLAHCVAEDMRMGSGIAVTFRQTFKHVDELLDQRKRQGNVAILEHEGRYIYYLVTKRESNGKPTMETLQRSLEAMRDHVKEKQVKKIAMPRIGCGLDRLDWQKVRPLIEYTFKETGAQITIYNYNEDMCESSKQKPTSNVRFQNAEKPVADIEPQTAILCLCTADGSIDSTLESLDRKFRIMTQYQNMEKKLGNILEISKNNYLIFLLIVKEKKSSLLSFLALGKCVRQACKLIDKKQFYYVAVESFDDKNDPFLFERVVTVIKTYLDTKWGKELWLCCPKRDPWK